MKRLIVLLIVLFLLVASTTVAMAANTVTVYVDGVRVNFPDQKAYINSDNRTLVPVRFVSEALGADVEWNA
ncbi:MAG: stalk domain-containing protein, partial [Peptococcia bacterium]